MVQVQYDVMILKKYNTASKQILFPVKLLAVSLRLKVKNVFISPLPKINLMEIFECLYFISVSFRIMSTKQNMIDSKQFFLFC